MNGIQVSNEEATHETHRCNVAICSRRARKAGSHRGAAVVEFAVVAPLLVMLTFGMIEISRVVMVKQILINASREGARLAVLPTSNEYQVQSQVANELAACYINGASVSISPEALSSAPAGTPVTVSIEVSAASVSWLPKPMFVISQTLSAATTMRRESL